MNPTHFDNCYRTLSLSRRPARHDKSLQAWDAADEYLLATLHERRRDFATALTINDQFGALSLPPPGASICAWGDSRTAHLALADNLRRNGPADEIDIELLPATQTPHGVFDVVLWRIPKKLGLLAQQLHALALCTTTDTLLLAGGMLKHLPPSVHETLAALGTVEVLPAHRKARVFCIARDPALQPAAPPEKALAIADYNLQLTAGPNVFAGDKFDIGARFFIEQFSRLPPAQRIADLGCGNGILGIMAQRLQPSAHLHFFDDSYQAVAAAQANYSANTPTNAPTTATATPAQFSVDDVFSEYRGEPFDLILCNPPFHQGHVVGDQIAWQMFLQSRQQLQAGGELWIVGNRHLQYQAALKKIFVNCRQIAANAKFVVLAASVQ